MSTLVSLHHPNMADLSHPTGADLGFVMRGGTDNVAGCLHPAKLGGMPPRKILKFKLLRDAF